MLRYLLNSGVNVNAQDKVRCRTAYLVVCARQCSSAKSCPLQDSSRHCVPDHRVLKLPSPTTDAAQPAALWQRLALGMSRTAGFFSTWVVPDGWMFTQPAACACLWSGHIWVHPPGYPVCWHLLVALSTKALLSLMLPPNMSATPASACSWEGTHAPGHSSGSALQDWTPSAGHCLQLGRAALHLTTLQHHADTHGRIHCRNSACCSAVPKGYPDSCKGQRFRILFHQLFAHPKAGSLAMSQSVSCSLGGWSCTWQPSRAKSTVASDKVLVACSLGGRPCTWQPSRATPTQCWACSPTARTPTCVTTGA